MPEGPFSEIHSYTESKPQNPEFGNSSENLHLWMHFADLSSTIPTSESPALPGHNDNFCDLVYRI